MKKITLLVLSMLLSAGILVSQEWIQDLPKDKLENGTLTFTEIQKAFYDFWEPYNVDKGYYMENGEKVKAPYYKQFKRWEWYWEQRVNPKTGAFPTQEELDNAYSSLEDQKSLSGNWTTLGPNTSPGGYAVNKRIT